VGERRRGGREYGGKECETERGGCDDEKEPEGQRLGRGDGPQREGEALPARRQHLKARPTTGLGEGRGARG
jgi:hypothetical protein